MLPKLEKGSRLLSRAGRALVEQLDLVAEMGADLDPGALRTAVTAEVGASKEQVLAGRLEEAGDDVLVRVVTPADGHARLSMEKLGALGESPSLKWLRAACQAMLPRIDLPELLLEMHSWTSFLDAYVHLADISTRTPRPLVALLISEACNVGLTSDQGRGRGADPWPPVPRRPELRACRDARRGKPDPDRAQRGVPIVALWGGGLLASVDGLRFVVPVQRINVAPSPKYFGHNRGLTLLNAVNDQVMRIGQMVVPDTPRDSLYILDTLINIEAGPQHEVVTTDQASDLDTVFGIFSMLGYRFAPRFAGLGGATAVLALGGARQQHPGRLWAVHVRPGWAAHRSGRRSPSTAGSTRPSPCCPSWTRSTTPTAAS
ncbi:Tn3 family transposase [[Actinomadura] parvosata]|uniref:Tn3 family transposase n=1 Tax=[Actinomadura] parvosata TaxID=1955412 RepID=UPI003002BAF8